MLYGGAAGPANRVGRAANDPPGPHALTEVRSQKSEVRNLRYDANGNMTEIDGLRCTWDFKDRLVAVEDDTMRAEYRYDYTDRRVIKKVWSKPATNAPPANPQSSAVVYPGKHFEVREHDEPNKYVFNGDSRVAHVTGSLSTNHRIQRLRLYTGWNLCSLAVGGSSLASDAIAAAYQWNQSDHNWLPVSTNETLEAGTVLWLLAATNTTLALTGTYSDPTNQFIASGSSFVPSAGLECRKRSGIDGDLAWSSFDPLHRLWQIHKPFIPVVDRGLPEAIAPGQAMFIDSEATAELEVPRPMLRVRYYHHDHLGSSSAMTDTDGALVEETAFYPFGMERHTHRLHEVEEKYKFTEKERDRESGLHYFEARYLTSTLSRFITPDPKYASPGDLSSADLGSFLAQPQALNLYAYAVNNPVRYDDPTGLDAQDTVNWSVDAAGAAAAGAEEASLWNYRFNPRATSPSAGTAVSIAGKTTAVISVAWKTAEFINDPSEATGAQLANEGAKTLMGIAVPPVGLIWSVLDLTGYGPSQTLEAIDRTTQAHKQAAAAHRQTAAIYQATAKMINEAAPRIEAKQQHARERLKVLKQATAKLNRTNQKVLKGDTRSLAELNAAIERQERINRRTAAQARYWEAKARKAQQ
jgi:RHS repeat-associated protein